MGTLTSRPAAPDGAMPRDRRYRHPSLLLIPVVVALLLWADALSRVRVRSMTDLGLVSVLPWTGYAALAVMAAGFAGVLLVRDAPRRLLAAYPLVLTALFYLTPPLLYGNARYSWAWKHAGIVDYIQRNGSVDPHIATLSVYHNWPGFFAFNAMLTDLTGLHSPLSYAAWAEAFFNVLTVGAVMALLASLTTAVRTVAVGGWLFALGNWVGQGYWSPQALNYLWYLLVITVLVRWFPVRPASALVPDLREATGDGALPAPARPWQRVALMSVVLLLLAGIVSTHQLTPLATVLTVTALVVFRRTDARGLPLLTAVMMLAWLLYVAAPFTQSNVKGMLNAVGAVDNNVRGTLIGYGDVSPGLMLVSLVARFLTLAICALAGLGFLVSLRRGGFDRTALVLAAVPVFLVALSPYGSEILFRAYLFALPGLVFFAAHLLWPPGAARTRGRALVIAVSSLGLMVGFLFAQFGNDRRYHFSAAEVAAAQYLYSHAPPGSLLVEGSRNYPSQFKNYDNFTYVPIDLEEPDTKEQIYRRPAQVLADWMDDQDFTAAFLIITRSQLVETRATGDLPGGGLRSIESRIRRSPAFRVMYQNRDAVIFVLADRSGAPRDHRSVGGTG